MAEYVKQMGAKLRRFGNALEKFGKRVAEIAEVATRICDTLKSAEIKVDADNDCVVKISITIMSGNNEVQMLRGDDNG